MISNQKLNTVDQKIIEILQGNARTSFATIGKYLNLSAPAIGKRVKQLEDKGVILGYTIRLNNEKLGVAIRAYINLNIHQSSTIRTAHNQIKYYREVQRCDRITGEDSLSILAFFKDNKELITLLERISQYGVPNTRIILES